MAELNPAEQFLLEQIKQGSSEAWDQLVGRYQGRLLSFAQSSLGQKADAEDVVQDTFIAFLRSLDRYRGDAGIETWLFTILRRKIIDTYRGRQSKKNLCLVNDVYRADDNDSHGDMFDRIAGTEPTASWYVRQDEQHELHKEALLQALQTLVTDLKDSLNFRNLQIVDLVFYARIANQQIAAMLDISEKNVAVIKHRCLKQVHSLIEAKDFCGDPLADSFETLLTDVWEALRPSCPKRSTIGQWLLGTLESQWQDYVDFHLNKLGCRFCLANLDDLKEQSEATRQNVFRQRIMESTIGFLSRPH